MKIFIAGDIVGRSGREVVEKYLPKIINNEVIDFIVINGENSAGGFGITPKICKNLYKIGVDAITSGNHIWDQSEILAYIDSDLRLIRPCNFLPSAPGKGYGVFETKNGTTICVINVMCRLFMDSLEDPFSSVKDILEIIKLKHNNPIVILDIHGESTSEKMAIAHYFDGEITVMYGTHTHVPTSDLQVLEKGSFFQTDLGMCGDYDSVIGMKKENSVLRFVHKHKKVRLETADGEGTLSGTIIEIDEKKNLIIDFKPVLLGGKLDR